MTAPKRPADVCKECWLETGGIKPKSGWRPLATKNGVPVPGPRCVTHQRARRKVTRTRAHETRLEKTYEMPMPMYLALKAYQGGKCYGCGRATGASKNLAVDHDHELAKLHGHPVDKGCPGCWRCLACGPCNQILGRYDIPALLRLIDVLGPNPPARRLFTQREDPTDVSE